MNNDTKRLLEECSAGCKMAMNSMEQVEPEVTEDHLRQIIAAYRKKHEAIEGEAAARLNREGKPDKEASALASAFSWFTTEMKLMMKEDDHQIAKLMMDGCNMGIQSICQYQNRFTEAEPEAVSLAERLVHEEESFMKELKSFL